MGKRGVGLPTLPLGSKMSRQQRHAAVGISAGSLPASSPGTPALRPNSNTASSSGRTDQPKTKAVVTVAPKGKKPSDKLDNSEAAILEYEADKFSAGSWATRAAWGTTWRDYHGKAIRLNHAIAGEDVFPLSPVLVANIAALMKLDNYRSFTNYLSWAKREHLRLGHPWSIQLDLEAKEAVRSVSRGIGPSRQSASFELESLATCDSAVTNPLRGHPLFEFDFVILGSLWVMREIEVAWATRQDLLLDEGRLIASWKVPVSKTDPAAKACTRSWGCLCQRFPRGLCPYHRWLDYLGKLDNFLIVNGIPFDKESPLFPDAFNQVIKKAEAVIAIENCMSRTGAELADSGGRRRFGGHSMRVAGSRFWASHGLEVYKLQIFARWGSQCILRYVSDAPLATVTGDMLSGVTSVVESPADRSLVTLLEAHIREATQQFESLKAELSRLDHRHRPSFVMNAESKAWHKVLTGGASFPPAVWRTRCGWPYGFSRFEPSGVPPPGGARLCDNCFRTGPMVLGSPSDGEGD